MYPQMYLFLSWLVLASAKMSLFKLEGDVSGQEFVYYKIMHPGNLLLVLESVEGDADIYISEKNPSPTYNPDSYDFHSATCGTDSVTILKNLKRPMAVGIYGYSAYNRFTLEVYLMPDSDNAFYLYDEEDMNKEPGDNVENSINEKKEARKSTSKVKKKLKNMPNALWAFFEIFEMFFL